MDKRALDAWLTRDDEEPDAPRCINKGNRSYDPCEGEVEFWTADGLRFYPRCRKHGEAWLDMQSQHIRELNSDTPPTWFDPANAGERWDDDD